MNLRAAFFSLLLTFPILVNQAPGQVLTLEKKPSVDTDPIQISGVIVEQKKYSFTFQSGEKVYEVKVPRGATVSMELNQPKFDLEKRKVWVFPLANDSKSDAVSNASSTNPVKQVKNSSSSTQEGKPTEPENDANPTMVAFDLPNPAYLKASFVHAAQMKRIMGAKVLRLNNYSILPADPGAKAPSPDGQELELAGRLESSSDGKQIELVVDSKRFEVLPGHRGATMTGFSIPNLDPSNILLSISGDVDENDVIIARKIELIPIQPSQK